MSNLLVIGHRGVPSAAPENTLPSLRLAAQLGVHMIELDVQLTKDERVVVIHDETLERTTTGRGLVAEHTLSELKELDAGAWFSPEFQGTKIPTLEEAFKTIPHRLGINIELKNSVIDYVGLEKLVLSAIRQHRAKSRVIVSSFNWDSLSLVHRLEPKLKVGMLFDNITPELWSSARLLNAYSLHPNLKLISRDLIWQAHGWGYRIYPWVVNEADMVLKLAEMGADGFFTDCPQFLT